MATSQPVPRPRKRAEHQIVFASRGAERGWRDLCATQRNARADAWDFLTRTPTAVTATNYRLKGSLAIVTRANADHDRWQHRPTLKGSARIWFYVEDGTVYLERVDTSHPNGTK